MTLDKLPDKIWNLRMKLKLTQKQFAERLGISWPTVSRWENGKVLPSPMAMVLLNELEKNPDKETK